MSNTILPWSLAFMISIAVLVLSDLSSITITFPIEGAAQKQGDTINLIIYDNNNNTITKANTANDI
jgi:hypothetical protein